MDITKSHFISLSLMVYVLSSCFDLCFSQDDLLSVIETQGQAIAALQAQFAELSERQCECLRAETIAFEAYMDYPSVKSVTNRTIPFVKVKTDIGGAYSPATSIYTVPLDGTYIFYAHVDCSGDYRAFRINVNGRQQAIAHNDVDDHSLSAYAVLAVKKGDKVNLIHDRYGGVIDGGDESMFSGFRLGN